MSVCLEVGDAETYVYTWLVFLEPTVMYLYLRLIHRDLHAK